jgi:regulator of sirC expression with transglutaminase-like and TPR domain
MDPALRAFADLMQTPEAEIDLGLAALLVAQIERPDVIVNHHLERLDELAARSGAAGVADPLKALHRLREFLFHEEGFRGNAAEYYDPLNSCLDAVLDRKLGIPITLAILVIEVGRRVNLEVHGIGLPGHFVVTAAMPDGPVLLDPFDGGAVVTPERATELVGRALGRRVKLTDGHFAPVGKRQILARMLANLRGIYFECSEWGKALAVVERLIRLDADPANVRDRGTLLVKLGELYRGAADWGRYLDAADEPKDAKKVRQQLRRVREHLASLN